ncbi:MAG: DUF2283 domain-containing protein [Dehalococcoidia bacterium]|nr:MAG: DUF2283 domain-containing protein [Dehalococcoidia bacterium]
MKLSYHAETDSLYIDLNSRPGSDVIEIANGLVIDVDSEGNVVGIDIEHASRLLDLKTLETEGLPVQSAGG